MTRDEEKARDEKLRARREREAASDFKQVASTVFGRRVLWDLIDDRTNTHGASYSGEQTHETAYLEGRRSVGIQMAEQFKNLAPSDYVLMLTEALERRSAEDAPNDQEPGDGG